MDWLKEAQQYIITKKVGREELPVLGIGRTDGTPKVVVDAAGTNNLKAVLAGYEEKRACPHFTLDAATKTVLQHVPLRLAAPVFRNSSLTLNREGTVIWVNICKSPGRMLGGKDAFWAGQIVKSIADSVGVSGFHDAPVPLGAWASFSGVCFASSIMGISSPGPGEIELSEFLAGFRHRSKPAPAAPPPKPAIVVEEPVLAAEPAKAVSVLGYFKGDPIEPGAEGPMVDRLRAVLGLSPGSYDRVLLDRVHGLYRLAELEPNDTIDRKAWKVFDGLLKEKPKGEN